MALTQVTKAGLHDIALDHVFTIGASGTDHYTFQGEGLNGTVNDPTLYLTRGKTYRFENGTGAHPIRIQSTSGASGTAYNTGVTNNAGSGTVIVEVQHDAPDVLYYQCTSHAAMNGILYITGALADGGVTTAKIADDAVTDAKLANSINSAIAANTAKTSNATHTGDVTGSTSLTIANDAVTTAKIADDAVTTAKLAAGSVDNTALANNSINGNKLQDNCVATSEIQDEAVTLAKLPHGTSSNDGKFLRANNGADPTFETVSIPAGTTINNNADNRVITGSGTANTLEGESNLTFTSNVLKVQNGVSDANDSNLIHAVAGGTATRGIMIGTGRATGAAQNDGMGYIDAIDSDSNGYGAQLQFRLDGTRVVNIGYNGNDNVGIGEDYPLKKLTVAADTNTHALFLNHHDNYDDGWGFQSDSSTGHLRLDRSIGNNFNYRRICFHGDGGIAFQGDTAAANALDDYEEGTWTPTLTNVFAAGSNRVCLYRKIGQMVFITFDIYAASSNMDICTSGETVIGGLPFTTPSNFNSTMNVAIYMNNATGQQLNNYINTQPQIVIHGTARINNVRHLWGFGCYSAT